VALYGREAQECDELSFEEVRALHLLHCLYLICIVLLNLYSVF
jgi:hypothetical protein